ncbi:high-potential iron-sulfur protein [Alkalilimnicola ehrlichii]|uniref:high-potential iron-sulfur protein n=1 Tax=Alkalilimnicola ehrlichii TaxID=351052 RepID=UPI003BA19D40
MADTINQGRRRFLKTSALGVAAVPFTGLMLQQQVARADLPRLSEDDDIARSLDYRHDATEVTHSRYQDGQSCGTCALWAGGDADWGACRIIPGKAVARGGWCNAYVAG